MKKEKKKKRRQISFLSNRTHVDIQRYTVYTLCRYNEVDLYFKMLKINKINLFYHVQNLSYMEHVYDRYKPTKSENFIIYS